MVGATARVALEKQINATLVKQKRAYAVEIIHCICSFLPGIPG
jgi:hypothetical protein